MKHTIRRLLFGASTLVFVFLAPLVSTGSSHADPVINKFPMTFSPTANASSNLVTGSDGNLWFSTSNVSSANMNKATTTGTLSSTAVGGLVEGITTGPDGDLWFPNVVHDSINQMDTSGTIVASYSANPSGSFQGTAPTGITFGPDGNLWFTKQAAEEGLANGISDMDPTTGVVTDHPLPTSNAAPLSIVTGPDGNLWFTEGNGDQIGRITTAGVITEYPIPTSSASPDMIVAGPDGNLWFTEAGTNKIGRITTSGSITEFSLPTTGVGTLHITSGPDGNLWFTENDNKIGSITTSGQIAEYSLPSGTNPRGITTGSDGNIWFTGTNQVDQVILPSLPSAPKSLTALSPTNQCPSLSWTAPSGTVTSYNIYRDSALIGSTASTSYVDSTAGQGSHSYYVTAVNSTGESMPSNTINVVYDTAGPILAITSPAANSTVQGTDVTVSGTISDNLSGIQDNHVTIHLRPVQANGKLGGFLNTLYAPVNPDGTWSVSFDSTAYANGQYGVTTLANDNAGNSQTTVGGASLKPFSIAN